MKARDHPLEFHVDDAHIKKLFPAGMDRATLTYQMSDHLPLWIQINTDNDANQLRQLIQG